MSTIPITKDTRLFLSLAARPGNTGTFLFNRLFQHYGLDCIYKACLVQPGDLAAALQGFRALGIAGGGVSMPFKEEVCKHVDFLEREAKLAGAVNTLIRLADGRLVGHNTDFQAAVRALSSGPLSTVILGAGGSAAACCAVLLHSGASDVAVVSRDPKRARALAERFGFSWGSWDSLSQPPLFEQLINCTPVGMGGVSENRLDLPAVVWSRLKRVIDFPIHTRETALAAEARQRSVECVTGDTLARWQAAEQFYLYTGIRAEESLIERAPSAAEPARRAS